jgi:hypothetical protein
MLDTLLLCTALHLVFFRYSGYWRFGWRLNLVTTAWTHTTDDATVVWLHRTVTAANAAHDAWTIWRGMPPGWGMIVAMNSLTLSLGLSVLAHLDDKPRYRRWSQYLVTFTHGVMVLSEPR